MPTVLLVEDEGPVRQVVARMLRQSGYDVVQAGDGRDAWAYLRRAPVPIDLILADVVMPQMTGTELVALVLEHRPELPIVLMSGFSLEALEQRGLARPLVPLITKPFAQEELAEVVARALGRPAAG